MFSISFKLCIWKYNHIFQVTCKIQAGIMFTAMGLGLVSSTQLVSFFPSCLSCCSLKSNVALTCQEKCNAFILFSLACWFFLCDVQENYCLASRWCFTSKLPPCSWQFMHAKAISHIYGAHNSLLFLHKMVKWRRMWKDRLLFVPFDCNLCSVSAGAYRSALCLEVLQDCSKLPWGMDVHTGRGLRSIRH